MLRLGTLLPRQHGAWTIIGACFIIGAAAGGGINAAALLTLFAVILGYFVYHMIGIDAHVKGTAARILRIVALTTIVPAVSYASSGRAGIQMLFIWLACAVFFLLSFFRVRYLRNVRRLPLRRIGYMELIYTAVFTVVTVLILNIVRA